MKFVLAPDSYKGTMTAVQVCDTMRRAIKAEVPHATIDSVPMADGGEGTIEALLASTNGHLVGLEATSPFGVPVPARFGVIRYEGERCAVLEAASLFGLPMLEPGERNPLHTTSRGLGDVISSALDLGYRRFIIGLGGSATNDGGIGMLAALGACFYNADGKELYGFGRDLLELDRMDWTRLDGRLRSCSIIIASDVANPLLGREGATRVYGPQKGASTEEVDRLETAMARYADMMETMSGKNHADAPGAGAAGGIGFALLQLGGARVPGALVVERASGLRDRIARADWVFTGEGCSDGQTLYGKAPLHVARLAAATGKQACLISGSLGDQWERLLPYYSGCFSTVTYPAGADEIIRNAEKNLYAAVRNAVNMIVRMGGAQRQASEPSLRWEEFKDDKQ